MKNKTLCSLVLGMSLLVPLKNIDSKEYKYDVGNDGREEIIKVESKRKKEVNSYWNSIGIYVDFDRKKKTTGFTYTIGKRVPLKEFCWYGKQLTEKDIKFKDGEIKIQNRIIYQKENGDYEWRKKQVIQ